MKKLSHIYIEIFIFAVILTGCSEAPSSSDILTIDIVPQIDNPVTLKASDIISKMRYIALETTDSSLLDIASATIILQNEYFFIQYAHQSMQWLYMFDNNGKYIRQIGKQGQGPDEYLHFNFDVVNDTIYLYDGARRRILVYSYDNKCLKNINIRSDSLPIITHVRKCPEGFLCYQDPQMLYKKYGEPVPDLILLDENGEVKKVLHYRTMNINGPFPFGNSVHFKKHGDKIFVYLPLQDTIFSVSGENLKAEIIIDRGEHAVYPENMADRDKRRIANEKGLEIKEFAINDKWLFLYCRYHGESNLFMYNFDTKELKRVSDIINDMDNTFDIFSVELIGDQMLDGKSAFEIIEKNQIPESIKNLKEDDNPVIRISILK
jgi:hypothetical protein